MALATLQEAIDFQGILSPTAEQENTVQLLLDLASNWIETEIGRKIASHDYTEYYSGNGERDLLLRQRPATAVTSVYVDGEGRYGQAAGAFASTTLMTLGSDYTVKFDYPGQPTWSKTGILQWLGASYLGDWGWYASRPGGLLTPGMRVAGWPVGVGNIKVVYTAGWPAQQVPSDLKLACLKYVQTLQSATDNNRFQPTGESLGPYSYSQSQLASYAREVTTMREVIRKYREVAI